MIRGLYTAASGMIVRQAQQENLSNNISNINTPGYKKDNISFKAFEDYLIENRDKTVGGKNFINKLGTLEFGVGVDQTKTSFDQGVVEETGRNLDFALNGDGFFTVLDANGNQKYTRNGRFTVSQDGYLTTAEGYKVLGFTPGDEDNPVPIEVTSPDFKLSSDGSINTNDNSYKFYLRKFNGETDVIKDADNCYRTANNNVVSEAVDSSIVKQSSLEKSNVDAIQAITDMISIMRSYESNQKVLQQMDETLGKSVNDVGSVR